MASDVQICNMALSHIGSDTRVSSISPPDGSIEAGHCATFYNQARTEMLEPGNWNFTLARALLAEGGNTSTLWTYAYVLPSDCLRALRVLRAGSGLTVFNQDTAAYSSDDNDSAPFQIEGDTLFTHEPEAVLVYIRDVIDTAAFPPSFVSAFSYMLAAYVAGPVLKGNEGVKVSDAMRQRAMTLASVSATAAANASSQQTEFIPSQLRVRA